MAPPQSRSTTESSLLLTLSLASNAKLVTSAMTKIDQVGRVQYKHKLRCPHHLRQKRVSSVCPLFITCIPCLFAVIADFFVCCWDYLTWALMAYAAATTPFVTASTPISTVPSLSWSEFPASQNAYVFPHETFGREFSSLS